MKLFLELQLLILSVLKVLERVDGDGRVVGIDLLKWW